MLTGGEIATAETPDLGEKIELVSGEIIDFRNKRKIRIGRDPGMDLVLGNIEEGGDMVSKAHCAIVYDGNNYMVIDGSLSRDSKNGTYLNGNRINQTAKLYNGAILWIGSDVIRFRVEIY